MPSTDPGLEQALRLALAARASDAELARILASEVDAIGARRSRWSDGDDNDLAHGIDRIRAAATRDLLPRAPRTAADLLLRLIRLHPAITAQVRDSDGVVGSAVEDVVADFGLAYAALSLLSSVAPDAAARLVCRRLQGLGGDVDIVLRPASERLAAGHSTQDSYREAVARQHRAKMTFWARMNAAGLSWRR